MVELELLQQKMAETYNFTEKMQFTILLLIEILGNFFSVGLLDKPKIPSSLIQTHTHIADCIFFIINYIVYHNQSILSSFDTLPNISLLLK